GDFPVKRRHARYLCNFPVSVGILAPCPGDGTDGAFPIRGTAVDVATSGLRLSIDLPLAIGQELCLSPERESGPFEKFIPPRTKAEVVWVAKGVDGNLAGLRFAS
ncbi:MAG TPA: PilZ domain-containing protein, partial [Candidatus Deferrimicrobiaceae bacterium]